MKAVALIWLGCSAALVGFYVVRIGLLRRQLTRVDALLATRVRAVERANHRLLVDLMEPPRVEAWLFPSPEGVVVRWKVRGTSAAECATAIAESEWFRPTTEDAT